MKATEQPVHGRGNGASPPQAANVLARNTFTRILSFVLVFAAPTADCLIIAGCRRRRWPYTHLCAHKGFPPSAPSPRVCYSPRCCVLVIAITHHYFAPLLSYYFAAKEMAIHKCCVLWCGGLILSSSGPQGRSNRNITTLQPRHA